MKLPKSESLILFAFLVCIFLWGISKCSARRSDLVRKFQDFDSEELEERPVRRDTVVAPAPQQHVQQPVQQPVEQPPPPPPAQYNSTLRKPGADPGPAPSSTPAAKPSTTTPKTEAAKAGSTLYVTVDGWKVRKEPGLKGDPIEQLPLYTPVTFLNQKTEWTQEISLGYEKVTDHWVKVRTPSGKVGWVFGAGLHYYKMKRGGVAPDNPTPAQKKKN